MDFRIKYAGRSCEAITDNGNKIVYLLTSEDKMIFLSEICDNSDDASIIVLDCSFEPTVKMADTLEGSRIMEVIGIDRMNENSYSISVHPKFGFTWEKLKEVLFDLAQKFDL